VTRVLCLQALDVDLEIELEMSTADGKNLLQALARETQLGDEMEKDWQDDMLIRVLGHIDKGRDVPDHNKMQEGGFIVQRQVKQEEFFAHFLDPIPEEEKEKEAHSQIICYRVSYDHIKHPGACRVGRKGIDSPDTHHACCRVAQMSVEWLVTRSWFTHIVSFIVLLNCVVLASDHYGINQTTADILEAVNLSCTLLFVVEMALKIIGLGHRRYAEDSFNLFDAFLVVSSLVELALGDDAGGISVFRALRIFRIIKLTSSLKNFKIVIMTIMSVLPEIANFSCLIALFVFFYSVLGLHLFGGTFIDTEEDPRSHFDNFGWSVVTVFQILTGENWNTVMYDAMNNNGSMSFLYFVSLTVIGGYILLNLFLAVLLLKTMNAFNPKPLNLRMYYFLNRLKQPDVYLDPNATEDDEVFILAGRSLFVLDQHSEVRKYLKRVLSTPRFKNLIMISIFISSIALAVEEPDVRRGICCPNLKEIIEALDVVFTVVFTVEMLMKVICLGLFCESEYGYLRSSWNILDMAIVISSIVSLILKDSNVGWVRTFRILRALRPLRVVQRIPELRIVVNSLFKSLPTLANVMLVILIVMFIFGILFVQLYKGKFYHCDVDGEASGMFSLTDCIGTTVAASGEMVSLAWVKPPFSYDNVGESVITLFEVATLEMWLDMMYMSIDARGVGLEPEEWNNPIAAIFYLIFIVLSSWFLLQLLTGAIVTEYNKLNDEAGGKAFQSERQKRLVAKMVLVHKAEVLEPKYEWQARMQKNFTKTSTFQDVVAACIALNIAVMCLSYADQSKEYLETLDLFNGIFTVFFACESAVKIAAEGKHYFGDGWNLYDLFVVVVTLSELMYTAVVGSNAQEIPGATVLRVFRIARIFRLFARFERLMVLVHTVIFALPTFVNVGGLLLLIFFIYAVLGMHLLGTIEQGEMLNDYANFSNFGLSLLTVYRMATGESWNGIMYDCEVNPPDCDPDVVGIACGAPLVAILYFVSFQLIGQFVMLNLFIAVVLENFHTTNEKRETSITPEMFNTFQDCWTSIVGLDEFSDNGKERPHRLLPVELFDNLMSKLPENSKLGWTSEQKLNRRDPKTGKYPKQSELDQYFSQLPTRSFKVLVDRGHHLPKGAVETQHYREKIASSRPTRSPVPTLQVCYFILHVRCVSFLTVGL
jgi:hypothetical protein